MISVRLSGCKRKLNVGLSSQTMIPSIIKLCMIIATKELYELIEAGLSLSAASKYLAKKNNLTKRLIYNLY